MLFLVTVTLLSLSPLAKAAAIVEKQTESFEYINPTKDEQLRFQDKDFWFEIGKEHLEKNLRHDQESKKNVAKNVVILIGDGMGISTITAARIYKGQRNFGKSGEDHRLVFDDFPNVALVKTYNVDMQIPDSAGTATALFTGVKTRYKAVGLDVKSNKNISDEKTFEASKLETIMDWAQRANKSTGIITTTRITHATPASIYAHAHHRDWECDSEVPPNFKPFVKDIARQLVEDAPGNRFQVILGGGYQQLGHITEDKSDGECVRTDNLNLTQIWLDNHKNLKAAFVTNNAQLNGVGPDLDHLLGLFYHDHLPYELIRDKGPQGTPSLTEMTKKGLQILTKNPNGFVLMVEGGRIDHGHHKNYARMALEEASQFDDAVSLILQEAGPDTLIIVTADHSHAMTINGYSKRGNDILGYGILNDDYKPSLTITYANGPGFDYHFTPNATSVLGPWVDVRNDVNRLINPKYRHLATFQLDDETHGGEDVGIFATGPGSHLIRGVMEQNYVAHLVSYAACIGPRAVMNPECENSKSKVNSLVLDKITIFVIFLLVPLYV